MSWALALDVGNISASTQPVDPSFRTVPQNSHALLSPLVVGPPQFGQWADEIPLSALLFTPACRVRTINERITDVLSICCGSRPGACENHVPDQRTSTAA